jgi:hypothetical protein
LYRYICGLIGLGAFRAIFSSIFICSRINMLWVVRPEPAGKHDHGHCLCQGVPDTYKVKVWMQRFAPAEFQAANILPNEWRYCIHL